MKKLFIATVAASLVASSAFAQVFYRDPTTGFYQTDPRAAQILTPYQLQQMQTLQGQQDFQQQLTAPHPWLTPNY